MDLKNIFFNYNGLLQSNCLLFTDLIELEHLNSTFCSMKPHKIQDAELHFITYEFFFNEQMNPFFFSNHWHQHIVDVSFLLFLPLLLAAENVKRQKLQ